MGECMNSKATNIKYLNKWMWKWHFIAGVILMPIILLLTLTGSLYLYKNIYETYITQEMKKVKVIGQRLSYEKQLYLVKEYAGKTPSKFILQKKDDEASVFEVGKWSKKRTIIINPYTGEIQGDIKTSDTLMHKIKKLHGELLLGKVGTKVVELTASWTVVLILTGLYIWWQKNGWQLKGFFVIRFNSGKRAFFRDFHVVTAFWLSIFLLITLAGGLPWTDVWGSGFKKVQKMTNSGYPKNYNGKKLLSVVQDGEKVSLDEMVAITSNLELVGTVSISIPKKKNNVYSITNKAANITAQKVYHFDQYSAKEILSYNWQDVGAMRQARTWLMRFHQGLFGAWNWYLMLSVSLLFFLSGMAGIISYFIRKEKNDFGIPPVPEAFKLGYGIIFVTVCLGIFFPLFGLSVIAIIVFELMRTKFFQTASK